MSLRTFIAVDIGPLPELVSFEESLRNSGADLKLVEPDNIHITLKFLGETDEGVVEDIIGIIEQCSAEIQPFKLEFKGSGAFPNLNYLKVLWIGIKNYSPLEQLATCLDNELTTLGFKAEKRSFKPHITLARVKSPRAKKQLKRVIEHNKDKFFEEFDVKHIRLKKSVLDSRGPTYYTLGEVTLD
jgi:2'-5' RNA ligase